MGSPVLLLPSCEVSTSAGKRRAHAMSSRRTEDIPCGYAMKTHWIVLAVVLALYSAASILGIVVNAPRGGNWIWIDFRFALLVLGGFFIVPFVLSSTTAVYLLPRRGLVLAAAYVASAAIGVGGAWLACELGWFDAVDGWLRGRF